MSVVIRACAVLFDMDGTLIDSTAMVEEVWSEFATTHGVSAAEVIGFAHGRPSRDTIAKFLPRGASVDEWNTWIAEAEGSRFAGMAAVPGAVDFARALPPGAWAVVTSALREPALARLASVGFPTPPVMVGADDVRRGKPHREGYARAAAELGQEPPDCVVFEDTPAGVLAGRRAGCIVVAVGDADVGPVRARIADFRGVTWRSAGDGEFDLILN